MDLLWHVATQTIPAAYALLPGAMASREASAMLLAVGLQESGFTARRQRGGGPARGLWQFEVGGAMAVLTHPQSSPAATVAAKILLCPVTYAACHAALEYQDVLAAVFARLLLWADPRTMPPRHEAEKGWAIYRDCWRPGKPRPTDWAANFERAWLYDNGVK